MPHQRIDTVRLVMHAKPVHQRGCRAVHADDVHANARPPQLQHHLVQRRHGSDVPEMRLAQIDCQSFNLLTQVE